MNSFSNIFGSAEWIAASDSAALPLIRQRFRLAEVPASASLHIIGFGGFAAEINGVSVTEDLFLPLNTDFEERDFPSGEKTSHRIICEKFSVSHLLREGENEISMLLGSGWYTGVAKEKPFGGMKVCFRLLNGETDETLAASDTSAEWIPSFVTESRFDRGETQDFSHWQPSSETAWRPVCLADAPRSHYEFSDCPRDRVIATITPRLLKKEGGVTCYDAGEDLTGYPVLRAKGGTVSVEFSEILNEAGEPEPLHGYGQFLRFTSDGEERLLYPRFTWLGFRYFRVIGEAEVVSVKKVHAAVEVDSSFSSDHETLNWLYHAFLNSQLTNLHGGIPSDCPHIERRGYTGDGQLTCRAAMLTLDAESFYRKWINDIADCQDRLSGHVQYTAPYTHSGGGPGGWGCAIVAVPYEFWKRYGDLRPAEALFNGMLRYFDYLEAHSECDLVVRDRDGEWCLGDWCAPAPLVLPAPFVNNYFYVRSLRQASELARKLGHHEVLPLLAERISARLAAIDRSYLNRWDGNYLGNLQGANAFALDLGLGDERTLKNFISYYEEHPYYDTGIFGTEIVTRLLFEKGRPDLAFRLLTAAEPHGYGKWQREGSTTLWEYWGYYAAARGKTTYRDTRSYNHPMFGAPVASFFNHLLGVTNAEGEGGYSTVVIRPALPKGLDRAEGSFSTVLGKLGIRLRREGQRLCCVLELPEGIDAQLLLPDGSAHRLGGGIHPFCSDEQPK